MTHFRPSPALLRRGVPALLAAAVLVPLVPQAQTDELPLTGPAYRIADEAYRAYERGNYAAAAARAREALRLRPDVQRLHALLRDAEAAARRQADSAGRTDATPPPTTTARRAAPAGRSAAPATATARADRARTGGRTATARAAAPAFPPGPADRIVADGPDDAYGVPMLRMAWSLGAAPPAASLQALAAEPPPPPPAPLPDAPPPSDAEQAYQYLRERRSREAAVAFARADQAGALRPPQLLDAAYASLAAGDPTASAAYFRRALDAADVGQVPLTPQQRLDTKLAVADQERTSGASAALFYRGGGTLPGLTPEQGGDGSGGGRDRSLQAVAEAYWRPRQLKSFAGPNTYVDLYGRLLGTPYSGAGFAEGGASAQAAVGVRVRPLSSVNAVLAAERLIKVGSASRNDWLLRAAVSDGFGMAPRVDRDSWWAGDVYAEAGRYLDAGEKYVVSEGRLGRAWRLQRLDAPAVPGLSQAVLMPHAVVAADYNTGFARPRAVGAGVGVNLRTWWREDDRSGPKSYSDLTAQYRWRLGGDDRAQGLVVRLSYNY
ncbi:hypothetical protein [uncultured Xylophilus sp.]|uniref:NfrA family protein n=1 Tax=uncultured Xylophilus sp. TaxID=296832 RepID=UPI0025E10B1D|nr:hypothetical protein [uncultured Xylophilus sp.]